MIDIEEKFVPWSARRYSVNVKGEIFSHENGSKTLLKPKKINSRQVVELSWIFGCSDYELALVLLITLKSFIFQLLKLAIASKLVNKN